ncbi:hypothetical protein Rhopal_003072-T1 [Rhodotorula paludigena]|uniref:Uncharacterized protein n=1 Tax=Rhodotorula paludigena TaxID=86838 RepID=A0AAV5GJK0_9BASI|nr:hypothetical protein Rhopal_003072-T1 [Rhodotorula paludigena]
MCDRSTTGSDGAALAHWRILLGDVSYFRIFIVTQTILAIFGKHGLTHYVTVGGSKEKIVIGDLCIVETFDEHELKKVFATAEAARKDWTSHCSLFKYNDLDSRGYGRLLAALPEDDVGLLSGIEFLPPGLVAFFKSFVKELIDQNNVIDALGIAVDAQEDKRTMAALKMVNDFINGSHDEKATRLPRILSEPLLKKVWQAGAVKNADLPDGFLLPDQPAIDACFAAAEQFGYERTPGDAALPAILKRALELKKKNAAKDEKDEDDKAGDDEVKDASTAQPFVGAAHGGKGGSGASSTGKQVFGGAVGSKGTDGGSKDSLGVLGMSGKAPKKRKAMEEEEDEAPVQAKQRAYSGGSLGAPLKKPNPIILDSEDEFDELIDEDDRTTTPYSAGASSSKGVSNSKGVSGAKGKGKGV